MEKVVNKLSVVGLKDHRYLLSSEIQCDISIPEVAGPHPDTTTVLSKKSCILGAQAGPLQMECDDWLTGLPFYGKAKLNCGEQECFSLLHSVGFPSPWYADCEAAVLSFTYVYQVQYWPAAW